jgi:hypothetical protein
MNENGPINEESPVSSRHRASLSLEKT